MPTIRVREEDVERLTGLLREETSSLRNRLPPIVMRDGWPDIESERIAATIRAASLVHCETMIAAFIAATLEANGIDDTRDARYAVQEGVVRTRAWAHHVERAVP